MKHIYLIIISCLVFASPVNSFAQKSKNTLPSDLDPNLSKVVNKTEAVSSTVAIGSDEDCPSCRSHALTKRANDFTLPTQTGNKNSIETDATK